ncbi:MAG: hypothetical protein HN341_13200 [Verrucomicrobia bacterium]|jgi:hypothetical protein|nr:hypothetical protein [Verrucomicrobiota bacterium]
MNTRRALTLLSGLIALSATAMGFRLLPVDLSIPISWLWIPLFGGTVFINAFGLAAIVLMVPWEILSDALEKRSQLRVLARESARLGKIPATAPSLADECVVKPLRKQVA